MSLSEAITPLVVSGTKKSSSCSLVDDYYNGIQIQFMHIQSGSSLGLSCPVEE